ncbi:MAG: HIT domain-containing protein [Candidatus Heimdallarchaeota archaeon]|nr:HIT domain-containing protein [Candidatus Heimdallarchaeota archaeon]
MPDPDREQSSEKSEASQDWDRSLFDEAVLADQKFEYIMDKKKVQYRDQDEISCIICRIINYDDSVPRLEIYRDELCIVVLNVYPYQVGHTLIAPLRHVEGYEEYTQDEITKIGMVTQRVINMLKHAGMTNSLNIGWNQGSDSGGSIKHHHIHLVPRYRNELNFYEIIAKTKPYIRSLKDQEQLMLKYQSYIAGEKEIADLFES